MRISRKCADVPAFVHFDATNARRFKAVAVGSSILRHYENERRSVTVADSTDEGIITIIVRRRETGVSSVRGAVLDAIQRLELSILWFICHSTTWE